MGEIVAVPRWATPRTHSRKTTSKTVELVAESLGTPLMPWQSGVAAVACEIDPRTGNFAYRNVYITIGRQQGKTTLATSLFLARCLTATEPIHVTWSAQSGVAARKKVMTEIVPMLLRHPVYSKLVDIRWTNGHEAITFKHNGSVWDLTASNDSSGHGSTLDLGLVDEAFALHDSRMDQALLPAMNTRKNAQIWIISTVGTAQSSYLIEKINAGRKSVEEWNEDTRTCYFEYSANPDTDDPDDTDTWRKCMPALGLTIDIDIVKAAREALPETEFRRAYLNLWQVAEEEHGGFDPELWAACADGFSVLDRSKRFVLAVDVSPGGATACIAACGSADDGDKAHVELVAYDNGIDWVAPKLRELIDEYNPYKVVVNLYGATGVISTPLHNEDIEVSAMSGKDAVQACLAIEHGVYRDKLVHRSDPILNAAVDGATRKPVGEGLFRWTRKDVTVDICPLVAVTHAYWAYQNIIDDPDYDVGSTIF